jgi:hypothetical protein
LLAAALYVPGLHGEQVRSEREFNSDSAPWYPIEQLHVDPQVNPGYVGKKFTFVDVGIVTVFNGEFWNAVESMVILNDCSETVVSCKQDPNACAPIDVTVLGITNDLSGVPEKA